MVLINDVKPVLQKLASPFSCENGRKSKRKELARFPDEKGREGGEEMQSRRKQDIREEMRIKRGRLWELVEKNAKRDFLKGGGEGAGAWWGG